MGKRDRRRDRPPAPDYPIEARMADALAALGMANCPRPDKTHYATAEAAQHRLDWCAKHLPDHDHTATVYRCPCGRWTWGRSHRRQEATTDG